MARVAVCAKLSSSVFRAGTYEQLFYVADVKIARGFSRDLYINLGEHILTLMFPVRSSGMQRLIGLVPPELSHREKLGFEDIRAQVEPLLDIKVTRGKLVLHLSRPPSRCRQIPGGARFPCGRRRPHP